MMARSASEAAASASSASTVTAAFTFGLNGQVVPTAQMMRATLPFNLTGLPALSVPFRFSSAGLPINLQLAGNWLDEATILRLGALIEAASDLGSRRPDL